MVRKIILFNYNQVLELARTYQKLHNTKDMDEYEMGIVDGIEFVLFLTERMEE